MKRPCYRSQGHSMNRPMYKSRAAKVVRLLRFPCNVFLRCIVRSFRYRLDQLHYVVPRRAVEVRA